jgi:ArsR family transcriptional regulator, lead/cadmium/zinc/bismuth-responsive transcriptional repressor
MSLFEKDKKVISCIRKEADHKQITECRDYINSFDIKPLSSVLNLASNEIRLKILYLLHTQKELCPCDLSDILEMTIPAISQHLRKLKDARIIDYRKDKQTNYYFILDDNYSILNMMFTLIEETKGELVA